MSVLSRLALVPLALVLALSLAGCGGAEQTEPESMPPAEQGTTEPEAPSGEAEAPEAGTGDAAALTQEKCSQCHEYDRVEQAEKDRAGWEQTVDRMVANGLVLTDEERTTIIDYLASE